MKQTKRGAAVWKACGAVTAAALAMLGAQRDALAGDGELAALGGVGLAVLGADITFAVNGLVEATEGRRPQDGWLIAQTIVTVPQTVLFNAMMLGFNLDHDRQAGDIVTWVGLLPTTAVTALTTHGIWALADTRAPADALAGVSVLVGANTALSTSALGRAFTGRLHSRPTGALEMVWSAPGAAIGAYESSIAREQQGAWIALTAWSGALFVHGLASVIADQTRASDEESARAAQSRGAGRSAARGWWPRSFSMGPAVVSDGVARAPGVAVSGVF